MALSATLDAIQAGDRVRFVVHLINNGDESVTIPRGQHDSVEVSVRRNEAELWRWTIGIKRGNQGGTTIPPTDRVRWFCEWPDPTYGTYTGVATVTIDETSLESTSPVTVTKGVAKAAATTDPDDRSHSARGQEDARGPTARAQPSQREDDADQDTE